MAQLFCKNCGALNTVKEKQATVICKLCGTKNSVKLQANTSTISATVKSSEIIAKYQEAQSLLVEGKTLEAAKAFQNISYKDSKLKAKKLFDDCMAKVEELKANFEYDEAYNIINSLSEAFSIEQLKEKFVLEWNEYTYIEAAKLQNENKYEEAIHKYRKIEDYKDSRSLIELCKDYAEKYKIYAPNMEILKTCSTVEAYDEEKFLSAKEEISKILDFKDTRILFNKYCAEFQNTKFIKDLEKEAAEKRHTQTRREIDSTKIEVVKKSNAGKIIGITLAVLVVLGAAGFAVWYFLLNK